MQSMRGALRGLRGVVGGITTSVAVRVGDPAAELAAYANMVAADLVVVGGNAVFRASSIQGTATTDRLLRRLARPGMVVRNGQATVRNVLVAGAYDAQSSELAVARLITPPGASIVTLRLADPRRADRTNFSANSRSALANREQVRMINEVANELRADVIVIGSPTAANDGDDDIARLLARSSERSVVVVPAATNPRPDRRLRERAKGGAGSYAGCRSASGRAPASCAGAAEAGSLLWRPHHDAEPGRDGSPKSNRNDAPTVGGQA
jgi:nucleotide-binding universal stress UspA family protein